MKIANQIILQLREADRYACAKNPQLRRLAVILLDNIVELQLFRKSELVFARDRTTWYRGVRKHDRKQRRSVSHLHAELSLFAKDEGWISDSDVSLLNYTHKVRNKFYHEGRFDELDAELCIRLLYRFIDFHFPKWRTATWGVQLTPNDPIPIEQAVEDESGFSPLIVGCEDETDEHSSLVQSEDYWAKALPQILSYRPTESICYLIQRKATELLDSIQGRIDFISENYPINLFDVMIQRFSIFTDAFVDAWAAGKNPTIGEAINIYLAVLPHEERLLDMVDPQERTKEFHKNLGAHSIIPDPIPQPKIDAYREQVELLDQMTEPEGIELFLRMQDDLAHSSDAFRELALDLDIYIQRAIDERRGK